FGSDAQEPYNNNNPSSQLLLSPAPSAASTADALGYGRSKDSNSGNATASNSGNTTAGTSSQAEKAKTWVCCYTDTCDGWDYCIVLGCSHKAGWKNIQNSTNNIIKHLRRCHGITRSHQPDGTAKLPMGVIIDAFSKSRKWQWDPLRWRQVIIQVVVCNNWSFGVMAKPSTKQLLFCAHDVPSTDVLK
ncbi:hypothetical protein BG000_006531, partial [Podila horticola]